MPRDLEEIISKVLSVQFSGSVVSDSATLWIAEQQASLYITNFWSLLKLMSIESVMPSNHLVLCCPLLFPSIRVFSNVSALGIRWQSIGALASVLSMNIQGWYPLGLTGLISLLSKGLSKVFSNTTIWKHQFFDTQSSLWSNSHLYLTTGKTIALTRWNFVSKVMSLPFYMLSRFVIAFLPRNKRILIWWQQLPSAVILEPPKMKSDTIYFPIYLPWSDGTRFHDLSFLNVEF